MSLNIQLRDYTANKVHDVLFESRNAQSLFSCSHLVNNVRTPYLGCES